MPAAYEVTFRIVRPRWNGPTAESEDALAGVVLTAAGLDGGRRALEYRDVVGKLRAQLKAGLPVRVRVSAEQLVGFFLLRRAAGPGAVNRLKWEDAVEVGGDAAVEAAETAMVLA